MFGFSSDHDASGLPKRLASLQHENHRAVVSALHVHLDAHDRLEVLAMGDGLVSARGVKYGKLTLATTGEGLP